jgi:protein XagA
MLGGRARGVAVLLTAAGLPDAAVAGAWPMAPGHGQAILKYEHAEADEAFDVDGSIVPLFPRTDEQVSLFVEHGLTRRLTVQGEAAYTRGEDLFTRYDGRGPVSLGLRYTVLQTSRTVVSVYAGGVAAGEGRNAGYAPPNQGEGDVELRVLVGRSGYWRRRPVFAEAQLARFERSGLPDEVRLDSTLGLDVSRNWLVLLQSYAGQADGGGDAPLWVKGEASLVRRVGRTWRVQAGWRGSLAGRNSPLEQGPVVAVWRSF